MKEVKPVILYNKTFDVDTFEIKHIDSDIVLDGAQKLLIKENWDLYKYEAEKKGLTPWDGTYYRLNNIEEFQDTSNRDLKFSNIKYSEIRGLTHKQDLSRIPKVSRPNHISTGSLIKTSDGYFIFGVRNPNSMSSRSIDLIGGGLQPDEIKVNSFEDIFENQYKEIKEEIGVSKDEIETMEGIGVVLSSKYNVIFIFYTQLKVSKDEMGEIFSRKSDDEMKGLDFVTGDKLESYLSDKGSYRPLTAELYMKNTI